jgi:hypothetical protein
MNARISQLYFYLKAFNNKDYNFLFSKVKEHNNYKFYNSLNNFNHIEYTNLLISELGEDNTILVCNVINEKMRVVFRFNISTIEDVKSYFKKWEEIFKDKSNKHIKKIGKIISEVILDLDDNIIKEKHNSNQYDYLTLFEQIPSDGFLYTDMNPRIEYNTIFIEDKCVIKSGNKYKRV